MKFKKPVVFLSLSLSMLLITTTALAGGFRMYPDGTYGPDSGIESQMYPDGKYGPDFGKGSQMYPDGTYGTKTTSTLPRCILSCNYLSLAPFY